MSRLNEKEAEAGQPGEEGRIQQRRNWGVGRSGIPTPSDGAVVSMVWRLTRSSHGASGGPAEPWRGSSMRLRAACQGRSASLTS